MTIHIMTDIETLGTKGGATIIQVAAATFDITTGKVLSQYNRIVDIEKVDDLSVDGSTIKWWLNTDKELLTKLLHSGTVSEQEMIVEFHEWLSNQGELKERYLWGNGILFDNQKLQDKMRFYGLDYPIYYRNDRDVRTIVDLASKKLNMTEEELKESFKDESLHAHDAYDDVLYQINLVVSCHNTLI